MSKYVLKHKDWSLWIITEKELDKISELDQVLEVVNDSYHKNKLTNLNLFWNQYIKGSIDVVIPTRDKKTVDKFQWIKKDWQVYLSVINRVFSKENGWFAKACNDWAKINVSPSEFILFLNDDVELFKWDIEHIIKEFKDGSVGLVWAKCSETEWGVNWSLMAIRREIFEEIGWFDESYFFMWEDNDICENISRRWWKIAISKAKAKHKGRDSMDTESQIWKENFFKWREIYQNKWWDDKRIIATMIVWDENGRYLWSVIPKLQKSFADKIIIVLDNSNLETQKEILNLRDEKTIVMFHHERLFWEKENILRERVTSYAISQNAYWIMPVDADEVVDKELKLSDALALLENFDWIDFRIAHYWWEKRKVRIDWSFWRQFNIRLFRYRPEYWYKFYDRNIHCWSAPVYCYENRHITDYILHHYWYIRKEDTDKKIKRQEEYDSDMSKENPDFYKRYKTEPELMTFNKELFLKRCKI